MKKPISVQVDEQDYKELKAMAGRRGRPVAELVREAIAEDVVWERRSGTRFTAVPPRSLGHQLRPWTRDDLYEEMYASTLLKIHRQAVLRPRSRGTTGPRQPESHSDATTRGDYKRGKGG